MASIDRALFFESVRQSLFNKLSQDQVNGMEAILDAWEADYANWDLRWLAYALATTAHETAFEMLPIEEYGKGEGSDYGEPDPETGQTYYGRGYVQLTWRDNYARADKEIGLSGDNSCEWYAENALDPEYAAQIMFVGMRDGWFRGDKLQDFFNDTRDDPYTAREIINGDKHYTPDWANGESIGNLIAGYHKNFLTALTQAYIEEPYPPAPPEPAPEAHVAFAVVTSPGVKVIVTINDAEVYSDFR
jgi:hypothetical protein